MTRLTSSGEMDMMEAPLTRRRFLQTSVLAGAALPVFSSLLVACGDDDAEGEDDDGAAAAVTDHDSDEESQDAEPADEADDESDDDQPDDEADDEPAGADEPSPGGTFTIMGTREIDSLSPDNMGIVGQGDLSRNIHNPVLQIDPHFELQPVLAHSYDVSDDGLEYTFHIRDGVLFHDGEEFTVDDVKYTYDFYRDPENATVTASYFQGIEEIDLPDADTVHITLSSPNAPFLRQVGTVLIVPEHYHREIGEDAYKTAPIGTGPFKLREWRPAEFTELEAFEDYFRGRPYLDVVRYEVVPEAAVANVNLRTGEADAFLNELVAEDTLAFAEDEQFSDYTVKVTKEFRLTHFVLNNKAEIFQEREVRQAMMHALDRDRIIEDIYQGLGDKAHSSGTPANEFYYETDVRQYEFDLDQAAAILDQAGWEIGEDGIREKDGLRLSWTCTLLAGSQVAQEVALVAQQDFAKVGLDMQLAEAELSPVLEGLLSGELEMSLFGNSYSGTDPDSRITLESGAGGNFALFENEEVDELLAQGVQLVDPEERREVYSQIQKIVAEEVPFLFIMYAHRYDIFTPRIRGLPENPQGSRQMYHEMIDIWIDETRS